MLRAPSVALLATLLGCARASVGSPPPPNGRESPATFRRAADSLLADPRYRHAFLGVLVVDPERGDTLYSHNAGKLFMPASNQKLLTGAVALSQLGPEFRFSTSIVADGSIGDGVLHGNLRISGTGDPSVSDRMAGDAMIPLRAMAESLHSRGVTRVTGALVNGTDVFPDAAWGFGWSWDDTDFPYSAGVDELFFNEGFTEVRVRAGRIAGDPVEVRSAPNVRFPRLRSEATTVAAGSPIPRHRRLAVHHDSADRRLVIVSGDLPAGDSARLELSWRDQPQAFLEALHTALAERGIAVDGGTSDQRVATNGVGHEPSGTLLFSWSSPPLRDVLAAFEKPSQNQIGEILLKTLGRSRTGVGSADSGARVVREQLLAWGAREDGVVVRDGSGLSRYNVVSPETIVRVLDAMRRSPHFEVFHRALPVAGVDGTIRSRMRGTPAEGNVHAKTGTLNMVRSLSGYVTAGDGRLLLFSLMANHFTVPTRDIDALHEALAVRLAMLHRESR